MLAPLEQLPVDPQTTQPLVACACGSTDFEPEPDVMDTWATSSCTPMIIGRWIDDPAWFAQHFPASLRPQAHDIIRTWAFYTIVKSLYHTNDIPWREVMISGHGLSADRRKLSKSKEHNEVGPMEIMEKESADALRYWATTGRTGADSPLSPENIATGRRLVTKLWNASRFAESRLERFTNGARPAALLPTDRWLLSGRWRDAGDPPTLGGRAAARGMDARVRHRLVREPATAEANRPAVPLAALVA